MLLLTVAAHRQRRVARLHRSPHMYTRRDRLLQKCVAIIFAVLFSPFCVIKYGQHAMAKEKNTVLNERAEDLYTLRVLLFADPMAHRYSIASLARCCVGAAALITRCRVLLDTVGASSKQILSEHSDHRLLGIVVAIVVVAIIIGGQPSEQ